MGNRSFAIAAALTGLVYAMTGIAPAQFGYEDFFVVALISSFLVFSLAGFNLVFILEEVVYDVQRLTPLNDARYRFGPTVTVALLAWLLPLSPRVGLPAFPTVWIASVVSLVILAGWWFLRAFNPIREGPVLKELHMLVASSILMTGLIDGIQLLGGQAGLINSLFAYLVLVGTWLYVSYTTLQRTHFLLQGTNAVPWLLILLSASFALVQHAFLHFRAEEGLGVSVLLNQRLAYLVVGIMIGMAVYLAEASWRIFRRIRDDRRFTPTGRIIAGRFARVAETLFSAEKGVIQGAAYRVFAGIDVMLPGHQKAPQRPGMLHVGWELDQDSGRVTRLDEEE